MNEPARRIDWIRFKWNQMLVNQDSRLIVGVERPDTAHTVYFTVPPNFVAHNDSVAATLATLCGRKYSQIEFNFPISSKCVELISRGASADVRSSGSIEERQSGENISLNFSGGLDSLATFLLAPTKFKRVSFDFGAGYEHERAWFEQLNPDVICETNFRMKGHNKGHNPATYHTYWTFLGAASTLFADYLDLGSTSFGTVFETAPNLFRSEQPSERETDPFFAAAGLRDATFTAGLTEFGTAKIMLALGPNLIEDALKSVALPGTEKRVRKQLLIDAVRHANGGPMPNFEGYAYPTTRARFGNAYVVDFITLYFVKRYGCEIVSRWVSGLEVLDQTLLDKVEVDWFLRFNPRFLPDICPEVKSAVMSNLHKAGISLFCETDWESYRLTRELLIQHHRALSAAPAEA